MQCPHSLSSACLPLQVCLAAAASFVALLDLARSALAAMLPQRAAAALARLVAAAFLAGTCLLAVSRSAALVVNYGASMRIYNHLPQASLQLLKRATTAACCIVFCLLACPDLPNIRPPCCAFRRLWGLDLPSRCALERNGTASHPLSSFLGSGTACSSSSLGSRACCPVSLRQQRR